jgi:alkylhydroperoxidase family enzyme
VDPILRESIWSSGVDESQLADADRALLSLVSAVLRSPRVDESEFFHVREYLSDREIVEILQLIGFYWGLARLCTVLDLEIETATDLSSVNAVANLGGGR